MNKRFSTKSLCISGVIAALYAALTLIFAAISYGPVQFRISEAFTILPALFPEAIPGLTIGCLISNLLGSATPWDIVFGTLATLLASILTYKWRKNLWLAAAAPVVCNAVIVGLVLHFTIADVMLLPTMGSVGLGEAVVVYVLGVPLAYALRKTSLLRRLGIEAENSSDRLKK